MTRSELDYFKVQKTIGLTFLLMLGIIPLSFWFFFGVVILQPYLSLVCIGLGIYLYRNARKRLRSEN